MSVVISHPTGNEFSKAALMGFYNKGILQSYYTTLASFPGSILYKLGSFKGLSDIKRRSINTSLKPYVHTHPWKELGRQVAIKTGIKTLIKHETGYFSTDALYNNMDKYVSKKLKAEKRKGASAIYAYEDGAYYSFQKAKQLNLTCFYDLPIGYWRSMHNLLSQEKEINPEWACTFEGLNDSSQKLNKKDKEIQLADVMIVASSFTLLTLKDFPGQLPRVHVIPYAFPTALNRSFESFKNNRKLKFLFVGGLSQRKGLSYLFDALTGLENHVSLTVLGRTGTANCKILNDNLKKHTWISTLPHTKVLELMRQHDVLIFPSLFEGFGLVITESMAQGTPVITTERTAGPDVIKNNENGWIIKAGSVEALKAAIEKLLLKPHLIEEAGRQTLETAKKRTWEMYARELAEVVNNNTLI